MKLAKSLLLGTAAGLAGVVGAQAADLPVKKAAPVEYVRVCSTYGEGFFFVPGTDSCLRISGRVRVDIGYLEPQTRGDDTYSTRVRGRVNFDHRTATAYGLLRTYIRYEIDRNSGRFFFDNGRIQNSPNLAQGFIQFGGLTAGRVTSFFSNPDLPTAHMGTLRFDDAPDVNLVAYTYSFGNGFSATLSLEDPLSRRNLEVSGAAGFPFNQGGNYATGGYFLTPGGARMPDVVANVRYAGSWGSLQLSGAVHQVRDLAFNTTPATPNAFLPLYADTEYGFAVTLQGSVNLPVLGAGDAAWLALSYADGATAYINGGQDSPGYSSTIGAGPLGLVIADGFASGVSGDIKTTKAWSVAGGLTHNWSPTWNSSIFGSYAQFDVPGGASALDLATGTVSGLVDLKEYRVGANTFWTPVAGLQLGLEVLYTRVDPKGRVFVPVSGPGGTIAKATSSEDIWEGRLRIQRDF